MKKRGYNGSKKKVLVVRPSDFTAKMIQRLRDRGEYEFLFAESPSFAIEIAGKFHPDLIVYDHEAGNGFDQIMEILLDSVDILV